MKPSANLFRFVLGVCVALMPMASFAWWNSSYADRLPLAVATGANAPSGGYNGYTVSLSLDTASLVGAGEMQADCDDLRVVRYTGNGNWTELPRRVINCNSGSSEVHFQLQADIAASSTDNSYFLYYNHPGAGSPPSVSMTNVYLWWDDASIDRSGSYTRGRVDAWHGTGWDDSLTWDAAGYYTFDTGDNFTSGYRRAVNERDVYIEAEFFHTGCYAINMTTGLIVRGQIDSGSGGTESSDRYYASNRGHQASCGGGYGHDGDVLDGSRTSTAVDGANPSAIAVNQWRKQALAVFGTNPSRLRFWDSDTAWASTGFPGSGNLITSGTDANDHESAGFAGILTAQDQGRIRNVLIRRYTEPEPVVSTTVIRPVAEYRFDECAYDGTAGEVTDSANNYDGTAHSGLTTAENGVINNYLDMGDRREYISTSVPVGTEWTMTTWFQSPFASNGPSPYHIVGAMNGGGDLIFLERGSGNPNNRYRWGVYTPSGGIQYGSFRFGSLGNGWHHLAVVGVGGNLSIYIDGAFTDSVSLQATGTVGYIGTSFDNVGSNSAQGWRAPLDEYKLYNIGLGASEISSLFSNEDAGLNYDGTTRSTGPCGSVSLGSFVISAGASASTCSAHPVDVTAYDTDGNLYTDYTGSIAITTSSNHGDWSANTATNPVSDATADDGAATYTFDINDAGSVTLDLDNIHADDLTVTVSDAAAGVSATSAVISFRDNAFVLTAPDALGTTVVAGRPHELRIELEIMDTSTGECGTATDYDSGSQGLKAWITREPQDPGGTVPSVNSSPFADGAAPASNNITLDFSAGGVLRFDYDTTDVGRYYITFRDDTSGYAVDENGNPRVIEGSTPILTVRPFAIRLDNVQETASGNANPGDDTGSGDVFTCAGCDFEAQVSAVQWQSSDDADDDGVPDADAVLGSDGGIPANPVTAAFAWETVIDTTSPFTPATGALGALSNGTVADSDFSGGQAIPSTLRYSEVGSVTLTANVSDYLVPGISVQSVPVVVGRFAPDHFLVTVDPADFSLACGAMNYLSQPFLFGTAPLITISARAHANVGNTLTQNYEGAYWKLGGTFSGFNYTNNVANTTLIPPTVGVSYGDTTDIGGTVTFDLHGSENFVYSVVSLPAAPFDADVQLAIAVSDSDSVTGGASLDNIGFSVDTPDAGGDFNTTNDQLIRYGRMRLGNAYGSELLNLPVTMQVEYFDGTTWLVNTVDGCSEATLSFSDVDAGDGLNAATELCVLDSGSPGASGVGCASAAGADAYVENPPNAGDFNLTVQAPGAGNTGAADITAAVDAWLQYDWNGDGSAQNPTGRLVFGRYRGSDRTIFKSSGW